MEFLYKLYDMKYFGVGLIATIIVLIITFLIILFFGKKDEKDRKLEETKKLELENANNVIENNVTANIPVIEQPKVEEIKNNIEVVEEAKEENIEPSFDIPIIEEPLKAEVNSIEENIADVESPEVITENNIEEPIVDLVKQSAIPEEPAPTIEEIENHIQDNINNDGEIVDTGVDLEELFDTKPIENIELDASIVGEEVPLFEEETPEIKEETNEIISNEEIAVVAKPVESAFGTEFKKVEAPFSSVYAPEKKVVPTIELPKKVETPKVEEVVENVQNNDNAELSDFDSLFGEISNETYSIKR